MWASANQFHSTHVHCQETVKTSPACPYVYTTLQCKWTFNRNDHKYRYKHMSRGSASCKWWALVLVLLLHYFLFRNSGVVNIQSQKIFWTKTYNSLPMHSHWCPACLHSGMHMQPGQAKVQRARTKLVVIHWNWLQKYAKSCICSNLMVPMQNSHIWKLSWYNRWNRKSRSSPLTRLYRIIQNTANAEIPN